MSPACQLAPSRNEKSFSLSPFDMIIITRSMWWSTHTYRVAIWERKVDCCYLIIISITTWNLIILHEDVKIGHLTQSPLSFFLKWCNRARLLHLIYVLNGRRIGDFWNFLNDESCAQPLRNVFLFFFYLPDRDAYPLCPTQQSGTVHQSELPEQNSQGKVKDPIIVITEDV